MIRPKDDQLPRNVNGRVDGTRSVSRVDVTGMRDENRSRALTVPLFAEMLRDYAAELCGLRGIERPRDGWSSDHDLLVIIARVISRLPFAKKKSIDRKKASTQTNHEPHPKKKQELRLREEVNGKKV